MPLCQCTWGEVQRREYVQLYLDRFKMASCPCEAWWLFVSKADQNIPLWSQKWKGNMLQDTWLQRNGRVSPKSDDNMNDWRIRAWRPKLTCTANKRLVRLKRGSSLIPNLIGTYLCGAKNGKKICYRILDCREMGVEVLEVTITWTIRAWRSFTSVFTCVRPR